MQVLFKVQIPGALPSIMAGINQTIMMALSMVCLLYTSDAADDLLCVDLGGRRIIKKKQTPISVN